MKIDENKAQRLEYKLDQAGKYLQQLRSLLEMGEEEYHQDEMSKRVGERLFEIIAQIMIDSCTQLIPLLDAGTPDTYSDCIRILGEHDVLPERYVSKFENMIKMRNLIAHQYTTIDQKLVYSAITKLDEDFTLYKSCILEWIDKEKSAEDQNRR